MKDHKTNVLIRQLTVPERTKLKNCGKTKEMDVNYKCLFTILRVIKERANLK